MSWKPDHPAVWDEAIQAFTERYPHVRIEREIAPHSSTAYHDLLTQKLKNQDASVDVYFMDVIWVPEFAAAGWTRPLDDRFSDAMQAEFLPSTLQVGRYRSQLYGIPSRIDAGMLYYRTDLLAKYGFEPPRTWRDLVHQGETILVGEQSATPTLRGYSAQFKQYEGLVCNMLEIIGSYGGALIDEQSDTARLSSPETLAAIQFARTQLLGPMASRATLTYQEPESLAAFVRGNAVFHRNWPYAWEIANNPERSSIAGRVGVTSLPGSDGHQGVAALGGWLMGISTLSEHPDEAWDFIAFLTSHAMQRYFALQAGIAPSRTRLYNDPELLAANPQWRSQFAVLQSATARPRSPVYPALSHIMQRFFSRALAYPDLDLLPEARRAEQNMNRLLDLTRSEAS
ncbi:putative ABC transporter-binding protein [Nitrospira sp.]|nr:putative ABC transporter-binding protein [Nitrospira sp.]